MHSSPVRFHTIAKIKQISTTQFQQGWWSRPSEFGHLYFFLLYFSFHKRDFVCTFNQKFSFFRAAPAKQKNIYFFWLVQLPLWNSGCGYPRRLSCCVILPFSFPPHPSFFILFYSLAVYFILYVIGQAGCDSRVAPPPTHCTEIAGPKGHVAPAFFSFSAGSASSFSKWIYI